MTDFNRAMLSPDSVFHHPDDVVDDLSLTKQQKLRILEQWEYDAREIQVAEEENMRGDSESMLNRVLDAKHRVELELDKAA
jgi:hypothetical protein